MKIRLFDFDFIRENKFIDYIEEKLVYSRSEKISEIGLRLWNYRTR